MMSNKPIAFFKIGDTIENRRRNFLEDHWTLSATCGYLKILRKTKRVIKLPVKMFLSLWQ